jgi:DNA-binding winged helix-turn-helix (wHTH) protein/TolB-like protein/Flp pilus assembly protein TadD
MKDSSKSYQSEGEKPTHASAPDVYLFGPYQLDTRERVLLSGGQTVPLSRKAIETLIALVRRHGRVVTKEELLQTVWPDTFIEEGVLAQNILTLRKALQNPDWIETVPRRGYRFSAPVSLPETTQPETLRPEITASPKTSAPGASLRKRAIEAAVVAALIVAGFFAFRAARARGGPHDVPIRSLAVLPFQSIPKEPSYLGLGLADVLINRLGMLHQIAVRPTSAVRKFAEGAIADPLAAGRELGVDAVLEANIQRDGDRVRVTVLVLRVTDGASLWTAKFDQRDDTLFALEDSIAGEVANGLALDLTPSERQRLVKRYTENAAAWQAYLRGRYLWNRRTPETHQKAIEEFEQAERIDPRYALAYAGLADAYALLGSNPNRVMPRAQAMEKARSAALKALEIDSDLAEAHTALAFILMHYDWKLDDAEREYRRALSLNPSYPTAHQWHAVNLLVTGHRDDAVQELKTAQALDPASPMIMADMAELYIYTGRLAESEAEGRRALNLDPSFSIVRCWLSWALTGQRRFEEAAAILGPDPAGNDPARISALAYLDAAAGRQAEARERIAALVRLAKNDFGLASLVAASYASLGDAKAMIPWLERGLEERSGALLLLYVHPQFAPVRNDPQFREFVTRAGLPTLLAKK